MKTIEEIKPVQDRDDNIDYWYTQELITVNEAKSLLEKERKEANKAIEMAHGFLKKFDEQRAYEVLTHYLEKQKA